MSADVWVFVAHVACVQSPHGRPLGRSWVILKF